MPDRTKNKKHKTKKAAGGRLDSCSCVFGFVWIFVFFVSVFSVSLPARALADVRVLSTAYSALPTETSSGNTVSDAAVQTSVDAVRRAVDAADRSFDDPSRFLGPNPTAEREQNYWNAVAAYRRTLPNIYGGFNNLDQLFGANAGEAGLISQGVRAAADLERLMGSISSGQQNLSGQNGTQILGQLTAAESTINLLKNFGNTGLGAMREGQLALSGIGQLIPGIGDKIAPITNALGAFASLEQGFGGMQQSFGSLASSIPTARNAISAVADRSPAEAARTVTVVDASRLPGQIGREFPQDQRLAEATGAVGAKAGVAIKSGEKLKGDAQKAGDKEGVKEAGDKGVAPGEDKSSCNNSEGDTGKTGGKGVPVIEQKGALLSLTGKTNRLTNTICKHIAKIREIQENYLEKELQGSGSRDAKASELAKMYLQQAREQYDQLEKQGYLKSNDQKGPLYAENRQQLLDEDTRRVNKTLQADLSDLGWQRTQALTKALKQQEKDRYDEKARLTKRLGGETSDPEQDLQAERTSLGRLVLKITNPSRYYYEVQLEQLAAELQQRETQAMEDTEANLQEGQGYLPLREPTQKASDGTPRNYKTVTPGTLWRQAASDHKASSNLTETVLVNKDTDIKRAEQAPKVATQLRTNSSSANQNGGGNTGRGNSLQNILSTINTLRQTMCSFGDSSMCGGGSRNGGGGGNQGEGNPPPPPLAPAPTITIDGPESSVEDGSPFSLFIWKAENATKCYAGNNWLTYGDVEVGSQAHTPTFSTTTPSVMTRMGSELPLEGMGTVFHPIFFKAWLTSAKAPQNAGRSVAVQTSATTEVKFDLYSDTGAPLQRTTIVPNTENLDEFDRVTLSVEGIGDISTPARGAPPTARSVAGAIAASAQRWALPTGFLIFSVNEYLYIDRLIPPNLVIPRAAEYKLRCVGQGGETNRTVTVPFANVPFIPRPLENPPSFHSLPPPLLGDDTSIE